MIVDDDLFEKAAALSEIDNPSQLVNEALRALINRENTRGAAPRTVLKP